LCRLIDTAGWNGALRPLIINSRVAHFAP
jgi:hypothetical protein